jgi:hypothetical protein
VTGPPRDSKMSLFLMYHMVFKYNFTSKFFHLFFNDFRHRKVRNSNAICTKWYFRYHSKAIEDPASGKADLLIGFPAFLINGQLPITGQVLGKQGGIMMSWAHSSARVNPQLLETTIDILYYADKDLVTCNKD